MVQSLSLCLSKPPLPQRFDTPGHFSFPPPQDWELVYNSRGMGKDTEETLA